VSDHVLSTKQGQITTKEVPFSFSRLNIHLDEDLCFAGDLLVTNASDSSMFWSCDVRPIQYEFKLIGNTQSGAWLFAMTSGEQTLGHLEASTEVEKLPSFLGTTGQQDAEQSRAIELGGLRLVPNHTTSQAWEVDQKIYDHQGKIQNQVDEWLSGPYQDRIQDYLTNLLPRSSEITPHFDARGIPHEFIFVTLWESDYFTSPSYPVQVGGSGEVGPWQFTKSTGQGAQVGLKVFDLISDGGVRMAHSCDERGVLRKSSEGAAKYWAWLLKRFAKDPHLSVLAYNWGIGNVNSALKLCLASGGNSQSCRDPSTQRLSDAYRDGYNFWVMEGFNMAPRVRLDYVIKFLAA
ncbi:MAG TPA: transglycosylase SLT domain-containing protein, partial [Candidatus Obscuribacterales bacterium]